VHRIKSASTSLAPAPLREASNPARERRCSQMNLRRAVGAA